MIMKNYNESVEITHNPIWLYISDHPCHWWLMIKQANVLLKVTKHQLLVKRREITET